MMRVLVTGAAGLIGSHLYLLRRGHQVGGLAAFAAFHDPLRKRATIEGLPASGGQS